MFDWSKAFETGISDIDEQHQELFRIGGDLLLQLELHSGKALSEDIMDCLENLAMYAAYHFDTEESLFDQWGYYDCAEHIEEHRSFINHLEEFNLDQLDQDPEASVRDLLGFISHWIFRHISKTDFKYVPCATHYIEITG